MEGNSFWYARFPRTMACALAEEALAVSGAVIQAILANLDVAHQKKVMEEVKLLAKQGKTVIMVLHDLTQVFSQADHLVIRERGRIRQMGSPEEIDHSDVIQKVFGISMGRFQIGEEGKYDYC